VLGIFEKGSSEATTLWSEIDEKKLGEYLPGKGNARPMTLLPSAEAPVSLTGLHRRECDDVYVQLAAASDNVSFLLTGTHALQPRPVIKATLTAAQLATLKTLVKTKSKVDDWNNFVVVSADLDGDGTQEIVVEATDKILDDESFTFSVIVVFSPGHKPVLLGYLAAESDDASWTSLDSIADMNGDGSMELIILHDESWYDYHPYAVYRWTGTALDKINEFNWVERDCYAESEWPKAKK